MSDDLGLIIGSGLAALGPRIVASETVETRFGAPSSPVMTVEIENHRVACIARHGSAHSIAPHEVNYRANVWALHEAGVRRLIAVNVVGAIGAGFAPGDLAVPDQLIDYTSGRESTYGGDDFESLHVEFTEPFDPVLRGQIAVAAVACGHSIRRGVYAVMQGPRLETAAEIDRLERDGCTMVGMTAMPEAVLARELGVDYALLAVAVNYAAGRSPGAAPIHGQIRKSMADGMARVTQLLARLVPELLRGTS
ncbi:S-methyl-5'-thioinosine phosphorylase [Candidatus Rariloculus sp.]|uniref:S-methyl-5'-thioinosine phosphorylase n=1 Tax=Candidatus Rariloculus sp. TaxID=3101265 RepID=UPI003D0C3DF2